MALTAFRHCPIRQKRQSSTDKEAFLGERINEDEMDNPYILESLVHVVSLVVQRL